MGPVQLKKIVRENFKKATNSSWGGDFTPVLLLKYNFYF